MLAYKSILKITLIFALCYYDYVGYAIPEQDMDPGPSPKASASSIPPPVEKITPSNTKSYPRPITPKMPVWPAQRQPTGALSGRIIYTSGGHGFHAVSSSSPWDSDRPTYQRISEDLGNQDQMTLFVYQAFNAGATVVPMRPVGNQTNEVVINNDDPQVTLTGTWTNSTGTPFYGSSGDPVHYLFTEASSVETATARFTPNIPVRGYYPVYGWALNSNNRCIDQLYRIHHAGGESEVRVNHRKVGKGWVYLGTYYFEAGTGGYCEISNQSSSPTNSNVIADAIRFGNGMGDINRYGTVSGLPREEEASRYWVQAMMGWGNGRDTSVYDRSGLSDGSDNVGAPLRMAAYMNDESEGVMTDRVFLSFHSNGGGGSARGALGLWNNEDYHFTDTNDEDNDGNTTEEIYPVQAGTYTPNQLELATFQGREVNLDMSAVGDPPLEYPWSSRTSHNYYGRRYAFGEIRWDTVNHEMDATINEVAFHDNLQDARLLADSKARTWIARAAVQGLIRYFHQFGGAPLKFAPSTPENVKVISNANGAVTITWTKPATTTYGGDAPTGYVVYSSENGYGFGTPRIVAGGNTTQLTITGVAPGQPVYFQVSSTNPGGESLPSEVLATITNGTSANNTLVVNAFDRMDRSMSPTETNIGLTAFERAKPWKSNSSDYIVQHAKALNAAGATFDSTSNEALTQTLLNSYDNVIWISGEESTVDHTFSATEQSMMTNFINAGNNLFASGAEIGWDLDFSNNGRSFFEGKLGANYVNDDSNTYAVSPLSGLFSTVGNFSFGPIAPKSNTSFPPANYAPYDADYPDIISPSGINGAQVLQYSTGQPAAVRAVIGNSKVILLGFPFECITSEMAREKIMTAVITDFTPPTSDVKDWSIY